MKDKLLLITPSTSYRTGAFTQAARKLEVSLSVATDAQQVFAKRDAVRFLTLDPQDTTANLKLISRHVAEVPANAVLGVDEWSVMLAARASHTLGLCSPTPNAVAICHDKYQFRQTLHDKGLCSTPYRLLSTNDDPVSAAKHVAYPCVLKPRHLNASCGVIRANCHTQFVAAFNRIKTILQTAHTGSDALRQSILVERYVSGREFAVEGILDGGDLHLLAVFGKVGALEGPYFEENIYITPARINGNERQRIVNALRAALFAVGLDQGPLHAEVRLTSSRVHILEVAARSIGGRCGATLRFTHGHTLEELIIMQALKRGVQESTPVPGVHGVAMLPIRRSGRLQAINGLDAARAIPGVSGVNLDVSVDDHLRAPPEGNRYPGFVFAAGKAHAEVEHSLYKAIETIDLDVDAST